MPQQTASRGSAALAQPGSAGRGGPNRPPQTSWGQMATPSLTETLPPLAPPRSRDEELVRYVGRHGLVAMRHVMDSLGVGRTAAYRRVAACVDAGLLERIDILRTEPGLLRATRDGLRFAGLGLPLAQVSPGTVEHHLRCATVARRAERRYGPERVLSEREIRLAEQIEGRRIAAAELDESRGRPRLHRADLAIRAEQGMIAVEVELTPKAPWRLQKLMRAWKWEVLASNVAEVHYLCAPCQTRRAVERAIENVSAESQIAIAEVPGR
jgi:hypothetical protein